MAPEDAERLLLSASLQVALLQLQRVADAATFSPDKAPEALKQLIVAFANKALTNAGVGGERSGMESFEALGERLQRIQERTRAALERVLGRKVG